MKTILRKGLYVVCFSAFLSLMASCLGGFDENELYTLTDAELLNFWLYSDSLPELQYVVFSVDNSSTTGKIFNYDSMAYKTKLPEKVQIGYHSGAGFDNVLNISNGDSIWLKQNDSIDISSPLTLEVYALDGETTKKYIAQLNIHQVDPDSLQYYPVASELPFLQTEDTKTVVYNDRFLAYYKHTSEHGNIIQIYSSPDAANWTEGGISGLPANAVISGIQSSGDRLFAYTREGELYVRYDLTLDQWILVEKPSSIKIKSILGYLNEGPKNPEGLCMIVETNGINSFAFTHDFINWDYDSSTPIPADFPLHGFTTYSHQVMLTERITIFGGISSNGTVQNAVWSTENGQYWAKLTSDSNVFPPLKGANVFYYDNELWMINGISDSSFNNKIYYSIDGGVTWKTKKKFITVENEEEVEVEEVDYEFPENYPLRYNSSLVMDKENKYFYTIGGKQADDILLTDVWKGFLNKKEFKH